MSINIKHMIVKIDLHKILFLLRITGEYNYEWAYSGVGIDDKC